MFISLFAVSKAMKLDRRKFGKVIGTSIFGIVFSDLKGLANPNPKSYQVKKGDTLSQIARKFHTSTDELKALNGLQSVHHIRAGQRLKLNESESAPQIPSKLLRQIGHEKVQKKRWKRIVVHHSATENGNAEIFHRAHLRRGMSNGLAYHFVIGNGTNSTKDGEIEIGSRWKKQIQGGHVRSASINETSIGICLVGHFMKQKPTAKQMKSLNDLTHFLQKDLLSGKPKVFGHKDLERNLCPGRFFPLDDFRKRFA